MGAGVLRLLILNALGLSVVVDRCEVGSMDLSFKFISVNVTITDLFFNTCFSILNGCCHSCCCLVCVYCQFCADPMSLCDLCPCVTEG